MVPLRYFTASVQQLKGEEGWLIMTNKNDKNKTPNDP